MSDTVHILGIAGSLRPESYNRAFLRAATQLAPADATIDMFEIHGIPLFNEDDEQKPPPRVVELKRRIREADAILFVTPEYNCSIPVLKNAIDWASRDNPWSGKPAAVMGASTSSLGTARAHYHLQQVMVSLNMFPLNQPEVMIGAANERFDTVGKLTDDETTEYVGLLVHSLVGWTRRIGEKEKAQVAFHGHQEDYDNEMLFAFI